MNKQLTDKQEMFCREYLIDLNASAAAIRAGYEKKWAAKNASRLTENDGIAKRIQQLKDKRAATLKIDADWVLKECVESYKYNGFYPVFTDTSKKPHNGQKECLCQREESTVQSLKKVPLNRFASPVSAAPK